MNAIGVLHQGGSRQGPARLLPWLVLALVALLVLYPLIVIVLNSFQSGGPEASSGYSLAAWRVALSDPLVRDSLWNTFLITVSRQAIAFPIAIAIAWVLARTDVPAANTIEFLFWLAFFLPVLPSALGWIMLLDPEVGLLNQLATMLPLVDRAPFNVFSFSGLLWTHLLTGTVAIKVMLLTPAFRNMDATLEEASRVSGASGLGTAIRVFLPVMTPILLVTLLLAIVYSMQTFELEAVLGPAFKFYVFSTQIYAQIHHNPPQYGQATALGSIILTLMLPLIVIERWSTHRRQYTVVSSGFKGHKVRLRRLRVPVLILVLGTALMMTGIPLAFLLLSTFMKFFGFFGMADAWTIDHWERVFRDGTIMGSIGTTLILAAGSAIAAVVLTTVIAYIVVRTTSAARMGLDLMSWIPATIPGILLGLGLMWAVLESPLFRPLYGTVHLMIIAAVIGSMPLCVQVIKANLLQLGKEFEECARVAGGTWWSMFRSILLPMITPTLLLVGAITFITASRNVASMALLASSTTRPLSLLQLDFMSDGQYESAAVVGVIVVILTTGVALVARIFGLRIGVSR